MADKDRLAQLLAWVRQRRENFYPPGWEYDPPYYVQRELELLLQQLQERKPA